jgi:hypothetical protein
MQHKGQGYYAYTERQNGLDLSSLYLNNLTLPIMYNSQVFCNKFSFSAIVIVIFAIVIELVGFLDWEPVRNQKTHASEFTPPSYLSDYDVTLQRLSIRPPATPTPDTTAVILNWSRLPNVVRIANVLCDKSLENTIATVLVWNNSPQELTEKVYFHLIFIQSKVTSFGLVGFHKISMQYWKTDNS